MRNSVKDSYLILVFTTIVFGEIHHCEDPILWKIGTELTKLDRGIAIWPHAGAWTWVPSPSTAHLQDPQPYPE